MLFLYKKGCYTSIRVNRRVYVQGPSYEALEKVKKQHLVQCARQYYKQPLLVHEGRKQWLFDQNGTRYLDMFGGIVTVSVGHCHP